MRRTKRCLLVLSLTLTLAAPAQGTTARPSDILEINGGRYLVLQEDNAGGKLAKQIIAGPHSSEISLDTDGDGIIDHWEVSNGTITIHASIPYRDRFSRIELSERTGKGIAEATLLLNADGKTYSYESARYRPFKIEKSSENIVIGNCLAKDPQLFAALTDFRDMLDNISKTDNLKRKNEILQILRQKEMDLIDDSCREGKFAKSLEPITDAMADVIVSTNQSGAEEPKFLRCLENHDLGVHAARIQQRFVKLLYSDDRPTHTPFRCEFKERTEKQIPYAFYTEATDQIVLHRPAEELDQQGPLKSKGMYAKNVFHEMLHLSKINSESMVVAAEDCCGGFPGDPDENGKRKVACQKLDQMVNDVKVYQVMSSVFRRQIPMFGGIQDLILDHFGPETGTALMKNFLTDMSKIDEAQNRIYQSCRAEGSNGDYGSCDQKCTENCAAKYASAIEIGIRNVFKLRCQAAQVNARDAASLDCSELAEEMIKAIRHVDAGCVPSGVNNARFKREPPDFIELLLIGSKAFADDTPKQCASHGLDSDYAVFLNKGSSPPATLDNIGLASRLTSLRETVRTGVKDPNFGVDPYGSGGLRSVTPREKAQARAEVLSERPIKGNEIAPKSIQAKKVELASADGGRADIVSREKYSTAVLGRGSKILKGVKEAAGRAILPPKAYAATLDRAPGATVRPEKERVIAQVQTRIAPTLSSGATQAKSPSPSNYTQPTKAAATLSVEMKTAFDIGAARRGAVNDASTQSQHPSRPTTVASTGSGAAYIRSADADSSRSPGATVVAAAPATPHHTPTGSPSTNGVGGLSGPNPRGIASVNASPSNANPLKDEFPNEEILARFLTGDYKSVSPRLRDTSFIMLLIDYNLQALDHNANPFGSRKPNAKKFKYDPKKGRLISQKESDNR